MKNLGLFVLLCVTAVLAVVGYSFQTRTLIDWWVPGTVALLISIPVGLALWRVMKTVTRSSKAIVNYPLALAVCWSLLIFCFYLPNYCFSRQDTRHEIMAPVVKKFTQTHYKTRRISKHTSVRGEKYYTYHYSVALPDSTTKSFSVSAGDFVKVRHGSDIQVTLEKGLFGVTVIKKYNIKPKSTSIKPKNLERKHFNYKPKSYNQ